MQTSRLSAAEHYDILVEHLVPMLPGSILNAQPVARNYEAPVVQEKHGSLLLSPDPKLRICFRLVRPTHPFDDDDVTLIGHFLRAIHQKLVAAGSPFFRFLVERCSQDAVASFVQHRSVDDELLPTILTMLQKWASETYEGHRISVAIGVDPAPEPSRISNLHLKEIVNYDFAKVLSNGLDTLLVLSPSGHVVEHLALEQTKNDSHTVNEWLAPHRYLPIASWSGSGRVTFTLNRHGEILIFKNSRLRFAYRRGRWSHFAHDALIARMTRHKGERKLMRAIYATCLDVSFSRTGACFAVAKRKNAKKTLDYVAPADLLSPATTSKSTLLKHFTGLPFDKMPRPIREEIAALDGAVVLDDKGVIVAAGAIVRVPGGSDGGGRRAAAKALSRLGLAVKVSSDGGISAFTDQGTQKEPEIAFEVSA